MRPCTLAHASLTVLALMAWLPLLAADPPPQPPITDPPPRQLPSVTSILELSAPVVTNTGHDFARLSWTPRTGLTVGHRVYGSRWGRSFIARYAPDLSGVYASDGEAIQVCTARDGILGEGRMALYLHSEDGGFSAIATGRWDPIQGGYAGAMLHSNDTSRSGPMLVFAHREGWLRMRNGGFWLAPEAYPSTPAGHAGLVAHSKPELACSLLPPPPSAFQAGAPDISGRYFSTFNESFAVCARNGSLMATFSGLGYLQGFAAGAWVAERQQWEGKVVEIGRIGRFVWRADERGVLSGEWDAYNRTYLQSITLSENATVETTWRARRDDAAQEQLPGALADGLSLAHVCSLLIAADSGSRRSFGDVADAEAQGALEQAMARAERNDDVPIGLVGELQPGYGAAMFETPVFTQVCHNVSNTHRLPDGTSLQNVTTECIDEDGGPYDSSGFYRRAPHEQRLSWGDDVLLAEVSGPDTVAVAAPLVVGERYIFRVVALYDHVEDGSAPMEGTDFGQRPGMYSAYSILIQIAISGPGAPVNLECRDVRPTALRLSWSPPPFAQRSGLWHGDGGAPLIGYRVIIRSADQPEWNSTVAASTTALHITLENLPPQTLWRIYVVAENTATRGRNSTTVSVATAALRATLWSECNFASNVHQPMAYQGCFREVDTPMDALDLAPAVALSTFTSRLTAELCARMCEPFLYFGLRAGGHCGCANSFGKYGAVEDVECDTPCTGEGSRMCGSTNRSSIYRQSGRHGVLLGVGTYHSYDLARMRLAPHSLSSAQLPTGLVLSLYSHDGLAGRRLELTESTACLGLHRCEVDRSANSWAEPPPRCYRDVWDDQAVSLTLTYAASPHPRYVPRPSAETGARAFALGTAGALARLADLGGDVLADAGVDRPARALTQFWRAPRQGEGEECVMRTGSYSSDRICLQPARMLVPDLQTTFAASNPYTLYETLEQSRLEAEYTDAFAQIKQEEWYTSLRAYARPFYASRAAAGQLASNVLFDEWFAEWSGSITHLVHMLTPGSNGSPPNLGLDAMGFPTAFHLAAAPPLPIHPFPPAGMNMRASSEENQASTSDAAPRPGPEHRRIVPGSSSGDVLPRHVVASGVVESVEPSHMTGDGLGGRSLAGESLFTTFT